MNLPARFPPYLSTHAMHGVCTPTQSTPTLTRGPRACQSFTMGQPIGNPKRQGATRRVWQSHRFRNRGSDCLSTHDAHCVVTGPCHLGNTTVARSLAMILQYSMPIRCAHLSNGRGALSHQQSRLSFKKSHGENMLSPPAGSMPLLRWVRGPLSIPCKPGTPAYMLQAKTKCKVCAHALPCATTAPKLTSLLREGPGVATCPRLQTPPLCLGGLQCHHMPRGSGPYLTT
jgi:hypothetical protein